MIKEVNYNYLKLLFEKKDKEEVIKSYVYKCEQLEKLYKSYEEKEIELLKKNYIIDDLKKYVNDNIQYYDDGEDCGVACCIDGFVVLKIIESGCKK